MAFLSDDSLQCMYTSTLFAVLIGLTSAQKHFDVIIQHVMHLFAGLFFDIEFRIAHVPSIIACSLLLNRDGYRAHRCSTEAAAAGAGGSGESGIPTNSTSQAATLSGVLDTVPRLLC